MLLAKGSSPSMLDSQGFVQLMLDLAWHCFCSQTGTYILTFKVDSKAASYPGTLKFMYNYKGTPLHACYFVYWSLYI